MYIPSAFAETNRDKIHSFMRQHSFALLTSQNGGALMASHLPLLLDASKGPFGHLHGHMARANPHWKHIEGEVMVVFSGPHAYVSPRWYAEEDVVPTWNYVAVHAYGEFQLVEERESLLRLLRDMVGLYESSNDNPWTFRAGDPYVERMLGAIVGFRIELTKLEGKWKLNQNHSAERQRRVAEQLAGKTDEDSRAVAEMIRANLNADSPPGT